MFLLLKKLTYILILNSSLLLVLMIGIQNSSNKRKVNFIIAETINLPTSFIIGLSFISGYATAGILSINFKKKN